jgi:hypothetical protein
MTGRDSFVCPSERHRADSFRIGANRSKHARARRSSIDARDDDDDDDGDGGDLLREVGASLGDSSRRGRGWEEYQAGDDDWKTTRDDDDDDDDDDARGV